MSSTIPCLLRKHFTKNRFADALLRFLRRDPTLIVDPCCGDGSLLRAAHKRWPEASLVGIDVRQFAPSLGDIPTVFRKGDALHKSWSLRGTPPDLIICNPPFHGQSRQELHDRTDVRFLDRAIRQIGDDGVLLFIIPYSLAANPAFESFRANLIHRFGVTHAIQLPPSAFEHTEARAVALIGRAQGTATRGVRFIELDADAGVQSLLQSRLSRDCRLDSHYYTATAAVPAVRSRTFKLSALVKKVRRGRYIKAADIVTNPTGAAFVGLRELASGHLNRFVKAHEAMNATAGDILLARVGRRAGMDILTVPPHATQVVANDCLYIITPALVDTEGLATALRSPYVQAQLFAVRRGIGASMISYKELLDIEVPLSRALLRASGAAALTRPGSR